MSVPQAGGMEAEKETPLPLRDWILLPVIALLTILFLAVAAESIARKLFPVSQTDFENCYVTGDPSGTASAKPNSVCSERMAESNYPVRYRFNSRGDREDGDLQPKRPGTYRIVMMGSSFAMGLFVPREMTFAALLPEDLSRQTERNIELYNEATGGKFRGGPFPIADSVLRIPSSVPAAHDMVLWIITPMDIENSELGPSVLKPQSPDVSPPAQLETKVGTSGFLSRLEKSVSHGTIWRKLRNRWQQSRTSLVIEHYLVASESPSQYVGSYLQNGSNTDFLKTEPGAHWQNLLENFEEQGERFEKQAHDAGIPFVAVLLPNRAQAAMISTNSWPSGYDPYKLDDELRAIIEDHGGVYVDVLPQFRNEPDPWMNYFPVDGHLNAEGHAMVSRILAKSLTTGAVPPLARSAHPHAMLAQGK